MWIDEEKELEKRVIEVVSDLSLDKHITLDSKLGLGGLGMDSLDIQELMIEIEEEFDITIPESSESISTVRDLLAAVKKQLEKEK